MAQTVSSIGVSGSGAVTEEQVHEVETQALQGAVDRLGQVLAVQGVVHVDRVIEAPEDLGRHDVVVALPAELA
jgi:hypothetical protein